MDHPDYFDEPTRIAEAVRLAFDAVDSGAVAVSRIVPDGAYYLIDVDSLEGTYRCRVEVDITGDFCPLSVTIDEKE